MKTGLDKGCFEEEKLVGMKDAEFLHMVREQAKSHGGKWVEALKQMRDGENIDDHADSLELSVEHPYWRGDKEERERVLSVIEAQLRLLERIWPERFRGGKLRKAKAVR